MTTLPPTSLALLKKIASAHTPPTAKELAEYFGNFSGKVQSGASTVRTHMTPLNRRKLVTRHKCKNATYYTATDAGRKVLDPTPVMTLPRGLIRHHSVLYTGQELQAFAGRPGAMAAFELPSLVGGQRVERVAPAIFAHRAVDAVERRARAG